MYTDVYRILDHWDFTQPHTPCRGITATSERRGMELPQSRYPSQPWESPRTESTNMPALAIRQSPGHRLPGPTSLLDTKLQDAPAMPRSECRSRSQSAQLQMSPVQLPPIREVGRLTHCPTTLLFTFQCTDFSKACGSLGSRRKTRRRVQSRCLTYIERQA